MISTKQFTVFELKDKIKYSKQKRNIYDYRMELFYFNGSNTDREVTIC